MRSITLLGILIGTKDTYEAMRPALPWCGYAPRLLRGGGRVGAYGKGEWKGRARRAARSAPARCTNRTSTAPSGAAGTVGGRLPSVFAHSFHCLGGGSRLGLSARAAGY